MNLEIDDTGNNNNCPGRGIGTNQELFPKSSEYSFRYHNLSPRGWTISRPTEDVIFTFFYQMDGRKTHIIKYKISSRECFTVSDNANNGRWQENPFRQENMILDLDRRGTRWEGGVLDHTPNGWGMLYNEDDWLVYEGFMRNGLYDGLGKLYGIGSEIVLYDGMFCHGKRQGWGIAYDFHGKMEYEGFFFDQPLSSKPVVYVDHGEGIANYVQNLTIGGDQLNELEGSLDMSSFPQLKYLHFLPSTCQHIHSLIVCRHPFIETIVVDHHSFGSIAQDCSDEMFQTSAFQINDCDKLQTIQIAFNSFLCTKRFELSSMLRNKLVDNVISYSIYLHDKYYKLSIDCPCLTTLSTDSYTFRACNTITITHLPLLQSLQLKDMSFDCGNHITITDMDCLTSISIGWFVFDGESTHDDETTFVKMKSGVELRIFLSTCRFAPITGLFRWKVFISRYSNGGNG